MKKLLHLGSKTIALSWGFCEAIFFFIVPDVYLSYVAIGEYKKSLILCLYAILGAVIGGLIMYAWGMYDYQQAIILLNYIPAISPGIVEQANSLIDGNDILSGMIKGALQGIPYKIFAVQAGNLSLPIIFFIIASAIARLFRFVIVTSFAALISHIFLKNIDIKIKRYIHLSAWCIFYVIFFMIMGF